MSNHEIIVSVLRKHLITRKWREGQRRIITRKKEKRGKAMKLETKYDLDQKVYAISNCNYGNHVSECSICNRTGRVTLKGEELTCPKCGGQSVVPISSIKKCCTIVQFDVRRTVARKAQSGDYDNNNHYLLDDVGQGSSRRRVVYLPAKKRQEPSAIGAIPNLKRGKIRP